jgi:ATP-dependent Clp protease ATP-binding subunit ClpA
MGNITLNEFDNILPYAQEACLKYGLREISTDVLLFAIADDMNCRAYVMLTDAGYKINDLKKALKERFGKGKQAPPTENYPLAVSVIGLFAVYCLQYANAPLDTLHLIQLIIRTNNTAAARILRQQGISLNSYNKIIYKPLNA